MPRLSKWSCACPPQACIMCCKSRPCPPPFYPSCYPACPPPCYPGCYPPPPCYPSPPPCYPGCYPPPPCYPSPPPCYPNCPYPCMPLQPQVIREQVFVPIPVPVSKCPTPSVSLLSIPCCPSPPIPSTCDPRISRIGDGDSCLPANIKRIHCPGKSIIPGYAGHIPGLKRHGAGRTHGSATKDTCCIMSQWNNCCPRLPRRIFEQ